jgi:ATP-dependent Clp protease adaptor protein ClpS
VIRGTLGARKAPIADLAIRSRNPKCRKSFIFGEAIMTGTNTSATATVLLLNDDETTMEFVVQVLGAVFGKTHEEALKLMLEIHRDGSGECGVYPLERASEIAAQVDALARGNGFPLGCIVKAGSTP